MQYSRLGRTGAKAPSTMFPGPGGTAPVTELCTSGYTDASLDRWAEQCTAWLAEGHDVHVYFDNDAAGHAPHDAVRLLQRVRGGALS